MARNFKGLENFFLSSLFRSFLNLYKQELRYSLIKMYVNTNLKTYRRARSVSFAFPVK